MRCKNSALISTGPPHSLTPDGRTLVSPLWSRGGERQERHSTHFSLFSVILTNHTFILATWQQGLSLDLLDLEQTDKRIGNGVHMRSILNMSSGSNQALHPLGVADCDHVSPGSSWPVTVGTWNHQHRRPRLCLDLSLRQSEPKVKLWTDRDLADRMC